jgi:hypothetical protein
MSRRSRTITTNGTLGTAAALAAFFAFAAPTLGDSSLISTSHPNLIAAATVGTHSVQLCFDKQLATTFNINDQDFFLQGYSEFRKTGSGLQVGTVVSSGSGFCASVVFNGVGDVRTYSNVTVLSGAVTSTAAAGGQVNGQGSVALTGSLFPNVPGATLRPQFTGATANSATTAVYNFSEILQGNVGANGKFGFYTYAAGDSAFHPGNVSAFTPGGSTVTISFSGTDATALSSASRFVVREGAVTDPLGQGNPLGATANPTLRLNLVNTSGVLNASTLTYHFDFDNAIPAGAAVCPTAYALFDSTGVRYSPSTAAAVIAPDRRSVALSFVPGSVGGDGAQITLATVSSGGLDATNCASGTTPLNSDGAVALSGATDHAGLTSGPDLISFFVDKSNGNVLYTFDAPVATGAINPGGFHLVDGNGTLTSPAPQASGGPLCPAAGGFSVNPSTPNVVIVNFAQPSCLLGLIGSLNLDAVNRAVGVTVDEGAVADATSGDLNPIKTLGITPPAPPAGPTTGPTTPPAPPVPVLPPLVIPPTVKKPTPTGCVTHKVITLHLLKSVSARLKSATATLNGKAYPVSKKLVITIALSKYTKIKTLTLKIKGKPKTGTQAINATRTYHPCGSSTTTTTTTKPASSKGGP